MFLNKIKDNKYIILFFLAYAVVFITFGLILNSYLLLALTFNMFLAAIGYGFAMLLEYVKETGSKKWVLILITFIWILFFPNIIYITTDFIHLQVYDFFLVYSESYTYTLSDWIILLAIFVGSVGSARVAIHTMYKVIKVWSIKEHIYLYVSGLFILSSVGIYIGRFIRLNSWDFYRLDIIFRDIFNNFSFFLGFVTIFICIHFVYLFVFKNYEVDNVISNQEANN